MARQTKAQIAAIELANVKAAQQAELKRLRAAKAAATRAANKEALAKMHAAADRIEAERVAAQCTAAEHVESVQPNALHADIESMFEGIEFPSARRVLVGFILGIAAAGITGYGIGMLLAYALAGIMMLTTTAWIAFAMTVLAWIIALYASWKIGGWVGGKVFSSVVLPEGLASRSAAVVANAASRSAGAVGGAASSAAGAVGSAATNAKAKVGGWFTSKPIVQAAPFSGAHTA